MADAQLTQAGLITLDISIPMWIPVPSITADIAIPMVQLDAYITAVVTATFEAYAVNLKSMPERPTNQVSRYTNFPFSQILRFGDDDYGLAANGLFKLTGDLDIAAAIPWALETGITDFKATQKKTVNSLLLGGRLGPAMTVTIKAGEQPAGLVAYTYSNVRGAYAQNYRQKFGKGLKARYIAFKLADATGGALELDTLDPEVDVLKRSI